MHRHTDMSKCRADPTRGGSAKNDMVTYRDSPQVVRKMSVNHHTNKVDSRYIFMLIEVKVTLVETLRI